MKIKMKILLLILLAGSVLKTAELQALDLSEFHDAPAGKSTVIAYDTFEKKSPHWKFPKGCRIVPGSGMGGTGALLCERTEKDSQPSHRKRKS